MRTALAMLAFAAAAVAPPAQAAPGVHVVFPQIAGFGGTVTCDTSGYPAATSYPCSLDLVTQYCATQVGSGGWVPCTIEVRGPLLAQPAFTPDGDCYVVPTGNFSVTYEDVTGYHVTQRATASALTQPNAAVVTGTRVVSTPYLLDVWSLNEPGTGSMLLGYQFPDIEPDCRTRAGGDPVGSGAPMTTDGEWVFVG